MALDWQGKEVTARLRRAQVEGIEATMAAAGIHAKNNHPWTNRTGILERSIGIIEHAKAGRTGARGIWGSQGAVYALILELGGQAGRALATTIPAFPYLRPAATAQYPGLARRIELAFSR